MINLDRIGNKLGLAEPVGVVPSVIMYAPRQD